MWVTLVYLLLISNLARKGLVGFFHSSSVFENSCYGFEKY